MKAKRLLISATVAILLVCGIAQAQNRPAIGWGGTYQLNEARSDNPYTVADRVSRNLPGPQQQRLRDEIMRRLESPDSLDIEVRGQIVTMGSPRSGQVSFDANGRAQVEQSRNGRIQRTTTTLAGNRLTVSTTGDRAIDYQVTFDLINNGQSLRVTRSITDESLRQPVVARSFYDKTSELPRWALRDNAGLARGFSMVPDGTPLLAILNDDLSTRYVSEGDRFTLTVRSPAQYNNAVIEGHVARIHRSGQVAGRAGMSLAYDRIRLPDGRSANFDGDLVSVRTPNGETMIVDNEGRVRDDDSQTDRTVTRTGVGAAIGAVIGAIAGGGKGAAIGAAIGAGAGAGSVFVQGRDDLDLIGGTEFRLRSYAP